MEVKYHPLILFIARLYEFLLVWFSTGFNVGAVSEGTEEYEVCKGVCNVPGFAMLSSLLPRHVDIPEIYHLIIALLLGHPVSGLYKTFLSYVIQTKVNISFS